MAKYTFTCDACGQRQEVVGRMADGPPKRLGCACGAEMRRVYSVDGLEMGGNAGDLLTGWMEENYYRAREGRERYSLKAVNRVPGESPRPGNNWHRGERERKEREGREQRRRREEVIH